MISLCSAQVPTLPPDEVATLLEHSAAVRGFWLDDELLGATGLTSVALLRKVQGLGLLEASYVPMSVGGRRRAWTFPNVLMAQLLVAFAEKSRIPIQGAAEFLLRPGAAWVAEAAELGRLAASADGIHLRQYRTTGSRLLIIDMDFVWFEVEPEKFRLAIGHPVAMGPNEDLLTSGALPLERAIRSCVTAMLVDFSGIDFTVCDQVKSGRKGS